MMADGPEKPLFRAVQFEIRACHVSTFSERIKTRSSQWHAGKKMGRKARSPQICQKMRDGGASPHCRPMNVRGLNRFTLTVIVFWLSVLGCVTLLWDPPHPKGLKFRHVAQIYETRF